MLNYDRVVENNNNFMGALIAPITFNLGLLNISTSSAWYYWLIVLAAGAISIGTFIMCYIPKDFMDFDDDKNLTESAIATNFSVGCAYIIWIIWTYLTNSHEQFMQSMTWQMWTLLSFDAAFILLPLIVPFFPLGFALIKLIYILIVEILIKVPAIIAKALLQIIFDIFLVALGIKKKKRP